MKIFFFFVLFAPVKFWHWITAVFLRSISKFYILFSVVSNGSLLGIYEHFMTEY